MNELPALIGIATTLALGAISPGPSFVMVARTAVSSSRADGLAAAIGMGAGGVMFAVAVLLGLHGLLLAVPSLYVVLKVGGGLYLAYLGWRIWRSARQPLDMSGLAAETNADIAKSLALGFATQASNPKTAIVYASMFAAFLPAAPSVEFSLTVVALVFAIEAGWYALVALTLSSDRPRKAYLRYKAWLDRGAGGVMMALGLKLLGSARQN
jgi:threonine/homoserine/homoserine lactone efflux protein